MARASGPELNLARIYYVEKGKTAKEIASTLNRTEKSVGNWVKKYKWKEERDALIFSAESQINNIRDIIQDCASERQDLSTKIKEAKKNKDYALAKELRAEVHQIGMEVSKWQKTLDSIHESNRVSLAQRIAIHDEIFTKIRQQEPAIYKNHILKIQEQMLQDTIKMYD